MERKEDRVVGVMKVQMKPKKECAVEKEVKVKVVMESLAGRTVIDVILEEYLSQVSVYVYLV